jgi:hypothetical protein
MVTPSQAEDLLLPLVVRAHAVNFRHTGFVDQAAEYLVRKLDLQKPSWLRGKFPARHYLELERCRWIDGQVLNFLDRHPHAMGVELGGGLSTRFQRLSGRIEWPRFSWVDMDSPDVIDCADMIFPPTDNYRLVACDNWGGNWLAKTRWRPGVPLIAVVETLAQPEEFSLLNQMLAPLVEAAEISSAPVHLILDYASPALQKIRKRLRCMLYGKSCDGFADAQDLFKRLNFNGQIIAETDLAAANLGPLLHRWVAKLYCRVTHKCFWGVVHFQVTRRT